MACVRIYKRRSNDQQSTYAPAAQESLMRIWCELNGHVIVGTYFDDDRSGGKADRPEFQRMIKEACDDPGSLILVHKYDRFARNTMHGLHYIYDVLQPKGVNVLSVAEQIDPWTPSGKMALTIFFAMATYHNDNLATEVAKGFREKHDSGGILGPLSFGYEAIYERDLKGDKIRKTAKLIPSIDAPTVMYIFTAYASSNFSDVQLAQDLNQRGVTFCRDGNVQTRYPFTSDTIGGILTNSAYIGEVNYHGETRQGAHQPLIDQELFARVQDIRARRHHAGRGRKAGVPAAETILREIAYCAECGARLSKQNSGRNNELPYYRCGAKRHSGTCTAKMIPVPLADGWVLNLLKGVQIPYGIRQAAIVLAQQQLQAAPGLGLDRELLTNKLKRLTKMYVEFHDISEADYIAQRTELRAQLTALDPIPARSLDVDQALDLLANLDSLFEGTTLAQQRALVHQIIDRVWVAKSGLKAIRPAPAFRLLFTVLQRSDVDNVTSTGLEPVTSSSGGWRSIH